MAGVNLESVSRAYPGGVLAVDQVSLEVRDREFLVLVGPSGCGKTTTLRLIAGLEELTAGNITIGTRLVNDVAAKDRDVAMVFQNYALYPHMTVYRNMAFGLELREGVGGVGRLWRWALSAEKQRASAQRRYSIAERVHNAARILGIEPLLDRYPRQLSGGERQRVALGRAIVRNPAVFLFDEPLSNLDAKLRVEMRRELKQLHQRLATTMVYVTHDQVEALTLGDRIVVMEGGKIQQVGPPMEVYDRPANRFVASFIGTPGMNFIEGHIALENQNWIFRRGDLKVSLAECGLKRPAKTIEPQAATLGVRPEHLRVFVEPTPGSHPGVVEVVEMLGDATVATVRLQIAEGGLADGHLTHNPNGVNVISKADARADLEAGKRVWVQADESRLQVFNEESGRNLIDRTPPIVAN